MLGGRCRQALHLVFVHLGEGLVHRAAEEEAAWDEVRLLLLDVLERERAQAELVLRDLRP